MPARPRPSAPYLSRTLRACRAISGLADPLLACRAAPRETMPRLSPPAVLCPTYPELSVPCLATTGRACRAYPHRAPPFPSMPAHACCACPGLAGTGLSAPCLRRLLNAKLGFDCVLSVALHYLEQTKPTASTGFTVGSACSNTYLQTATAHKV